jgi:hypothetical protein
MSEQQRRAWMRDAYLGWEAGQPVRHELMDGQVAEVPSMTENSSCDVEIRRYAAGLSA